MYPEIQLVEEWNGNWRFILPPRYFEIEEKLKEIDARYRGEDEEVIVQEALDVLQKEMPQHIGAILLLTGSLARMNYIEDAFRILEKNLAILFKSFPKNFKVGESRLPYEYEENRPFLHLYFIYGLFLEYMGYFEEAIEVYEGLLKMDPEDILFVREPVTRVYFRVERPIEVLNIIERYPEPATPTLNYAKALALYQIGRKEEAREVLKEAVEDDPIIAEELLKEEHPYDEDFQFPLEIEKGSKDEARLYYELYGEFWRGTEGAIEFLRSVWEEIN